jgi:hypothetical protein
MTKMIAAMFLLALGPTFVQQAKPSTADEINALKTRISGLQKKVCEMRTHYREDGSDDPECKGIPPRNRALELLQDSCKKTRSVELCSNLLPLSGPVDEQFVMNTFKITTKTKALAFFEWIVGQLDPNLDENSYLPVKTRERLSWFIKQRQEGKLPVTVAPGIITPSQQLNSGIRMITTFNGGKPTVTVNLGLLATWLWDNYIQDVPMSRHLKTELAITISHEVIHLTGDPTGEMTKAENRAEEKRAWAIEIFEDIRPLAEKGEFLQEDAARANEILKFCKDNLDCPEFLKFIDEHSLGFGN